MTRMNLDTPKAIIIGALIVVVGIFLNSAYERQLAFNKCVRLYKENPGGFTDYERADKWLKTFCEYHIYVRNRFSPELRIQID